VSFPQKTKLPSAVSAADTPFLFRRRQFLWRRQFSWRRQCSWRCPAGRLRQRWSLARLSLLSILTIASGCSGSQQLDAVEVLNYGQCTGLEPGLTIVDYATLASIRGSRLIAGPGTPSADPDVLLVALSRGAQPTPGYGFTLQAVSRERAQARIRVNWFSPPADAVLAQVITEPCLVVGLPRAGIERVEALDQSGVPIGSVDVTAPAR
jgi:hypothetical protein